MLTCNDLPFACWRQFILVYFFNRGHIFGIFVSQNTWSVLSEVTIRHAELNVPFTQGQNGHAIRTSRKNTEVLIESRNRPGNSSLNIIHQDTFKRTNEYCISPDFTTNSQVNNEDTSAYSFSWLCSCCGPCSSVHWRWSGAARKWVKGHSWRLRRGGPRWKVGPFRLLVRRTNSNKKGEIFDQVGSCRSKFLRLLTS